MTCRKKGKLFGGPPFLTGRVVSEGERGLERSNIERCYRLWTVLYGAECDFDDCLIGLASSLGWQEPASDVDLFTSLNSASEHIHNAGGSWQSMRQLAIDVFMACRQGDAVETSSYDGRTWGQAVDDSLFTGHTCRACAAGFPGSPKDHRRIAGAVLNGRTSWEKLQEALARH